MFDEVLEQEAQEVVEVVEEVVEGDEKLPETETPTE
jgi:hypothetical protein